MSMHGSAGGAPDVDRDGELRLVEQARAGAEWALGALVARYQPLLVRYLARLTGYSEGLAPLIEDIFVRMERRIQGPRGGDHLRIWLLRTATDEGLDVLRHPFVRRGLLLPMQRTLSLIGNGQDVLKGSITRPLRSQVNRQTRPLAFAQRTEALTLDNDPIDPKELLRHRLTRSVLAELPIDDARAMALHLIASLNTIEVAEAMGLAAPVARARIVAGLREFGARFDSLIALMGIPRDLAYGLESRIENPDGNYPGYLGPITVELPVVNSATGAPRVVDALPVHEEADAPAVPVARTEPFAPTVPVTQTDSAEQDGQ